MSSSIANADHDVYVVVHTVSFRLIAAGGGYAVVFAPTKPLPQPSVNA
jgi:hypothetical protein